MLSYSCIFMWYSKVNIRNKKVTGKTKLSTYKIGTIWKLKENNGPEERGSGSVAEKFNI